MLKVDYKAKLLQELKEMEDFDTKVFGVIAELKKSVDGVNLLVNENDPKTVKAHKMKVVRKINHFIESFKAKLQELENEIKTDKE